MASYDYEKKVSSTDLVNEANEIWDYVFKKRLNGNLETISDQNNVIAEILQKWRPFMTYYALIVRYMVSFGLYHPNAMAEWMDHIEKNGSWTCEDEQFRLLAKYVRILHKWCTPHKCYGDRFEQEVYNTLRDEREQFKQNAQKVADQYKDNIKDKIANMDEEDRAELIKSLNSKNKK